MKKPNVKSNYIYNLIYQVVAIILPIISTPYISKVLGANNIGIYGYTLSISAYFILFGSLGVALYGQREIAYVQKEKEKYSKAFFEIFFLKLICMTMSMLLFYFIFVRGNNNYTLYYKILLLEILANTLDISWLFQGLELFKKTVTRNLIVSKYNNHVNIINSYFKFDKSLVTSYNYASNASSYKNVSNSLVKDNSLLKSTSP